MITSQEVKDWAEKRMAQIHRDLERISATEIETAAMRGAITEQKKLLAALENKLPPVWIDAA